MIHKIFLNFCKINTHDTLHLHKYYKIFTKNFFVIVASLSKFFTKFHQIINFFLIFWEVNTKFS